ncbi:MAG: DUF4292 domain-containing protein [Bacteroides sp.]|nr:DUF4292 domain-containing protein [Bacteroides sp.]MCM1388952.1 DUF4292 domain-containing protein [Bacteroides sp.]
MKLSHILSVIVIGAVMGGCGSSKKVTGPDIDTGDSQASYSEVVKQYPAWTDVEVPLNIDISSPVNFSISGRAKMVRGNVVDISLRMLGFEVGRLYLNSDSVFGYVKMSKTCIAESLGDLTAQIPMNISNVQDLLTGGVFLLGNAVLAESNKADFMIEKDNGGIMLIPRKQPDKFQYGFFVNDNNRVARFVGGDNDRNIQCDYSGYSANKKNLPADVDVTVSIKRPVVASINWRWESAKWDTGLSPRFSMPRGYKRVRSQELLNHLPK